MRIIPFALERFLDANEQSVKHVLCASDPEPLQLQELLEMADDEGLKAWRDQSLGYTPSRGWEQLREQVAAASPGLDPDDVVITSGAGEALTLSFVALLAPGDHIVAVTPSYQSLHSVPAMIGAEVTRFNLEPRDSWALDVEDLAKNIRPSTKAIVVNFPNNPTGALPPVKVLRQLIGLAEASGATLISDEVYRGLEFDEACRWPVAASLNDSAISVDVVTKKFGLAGLRIGWVASKNAGLLDRIVKVKDYTSICNAAPSEILAYIALAERRALVQRSLRIVSENLQLLTDFICRNADIFSWHPPVAGTMAFPWLASGGDAASLVQRVLEQSGVLLLPGAFYGFPAHLRFGLGRTGFDEGLRALQNCIHDVWAC